MGLNTSIYRPHWRFPSVHGALRNRCHTLIFQRVNFIILLNLCIVTANYSQQIASPGTLKQVHISNKDNITSIVDEQIGQLQAEGYLNASADSINTINDSIQVYFTKGKKYYYRVTETSIPINILKESGTIVLISDLPVSFLDFGNATNSILSHFTNLGYPFAQIKRENIAIQDSIIAFKLHVEPGEQIKFATIDITGEIRLAQSFLSKYLDIKPGENYSDEKISEANKRLENLDFIDITQPVAIQFRPGIATLKITAEPRKTNMFDGIAGLNGGGNTGQPTTFTGYANLYLANSWGHGEKIALTWNGPGNTTQLLSLSGSYPYLFKLPIEPQINFSLQKQDTSWLQTIFRPSLIFPISSLSKTAVYWEIQNNNQISPTPSALVLSDSTITNFRLSTFGFEYHYQSAGFTKRLISKGVLLKIKLAGGKRKSENYHQPDSIQNTEEIVDGVIQTEISTEKRWQTSARSTFSLQLGGFYLSGQKLPYNQLRQLGGFQNLKGFDELSLAASAYAITSAEIRYFIDTESFFSFFLNGGLTESRLLSGNYFDTPVGGGVGMNLQTNAGIFSIYMALGFAREIPFQFRNTKIHLGYITRF